MKRQMPATVMGADPAEFASHSKNQQAGALAPLTQLSKWRVSICPDRRQHEIMARRFQGTLASNARRPFLAAIGALALGQPLVPLWAAPLVAQSGLSDPGAIPLEPLDAGIHQLQEDSYIIGPGDALDIKFLAASELSTSLNVLNDGTVTLPLIGSAKITGLTLPQATAWLEDLYRQQLLRPDLQLSVTQPRPLRISVVGQVEDPGLYTLNVTGDASRTEVGVGFSGLPTLVDAIQKAGGVTNLANLRSVTVQRRLPGPTPRFKRTQVNLLNLILEGDQFQNPLLFDGDVIRVNTANEGLPEFAEIASTTLAPTDITVNVIGEVKNPGEKTIPARTPLNKAILLAGGLEEWRAQGKRIELIRLNRNGSATRRVYRMNSEEGISPETNPALRDGDTIIVNRNYYAKTADAIGAVSQPISGLVNILALVRILGNTD